MWLLVAPRAAQVLMVMRASGSSRPILASTPRNGVVRGSQPETTARKSGRRLTRRCPVALHLSLFAGRARALRLPLRRFALGGAHLGERTLPACLVLRLPHDLLYGGGRCGRLYALDQVHGAFLPSRTPGRSPLVNSAPASSRARLIAARFAGMGSRCPASK